jgi:serpin B
MYRAILILLGICMCVSLFNCSDNPVEPEPDPPRQLTPGEMQLVESYNDFGIELFKAIIEVAEPGENVFISPLSVSMALGMTLNGAAGETEEAMKQTLAFSGMTMTEIDECYQSLIALLRTLDGSVDFRIANSVWYRDTFTFEDEFFDACSTYFDATVQGLNFSNPSAADIINSWVREQTNDRITEIVDKPIDPLLIMFLINAIYFKGTWTHQFDPARTMDDSFYLPDGSTVTCRMMNQEESTSCTYFRGDTFEALDLAYGRDLFSMSIILPREYVDVDSIIARLSAETWDDWMGRFDGWTGEVRIPKFQLEYELELKDVLSQLGMAVAFDPYGADFTRMYSPDGVYISKVKHKTFVKVDEEGTEAAAVTSVEAGITSGPPLFYARRPFIFAIREKHSNTILFMGKIYDPGY